MAEIIENIYYSIIYQAFYPFIAIAFLIFAIILFKKYLKEKSLKYLILILLASYFIYQIIPYSFIAKAKQVSKENEMIKNYELAILTSDSKTLKGIIYSEIAAYYFLDKNGTKAIENYENAYKYLKNYNSKRIWALAPSAYLYKGEYEKAGKIALDTEQYSIAAKASFLLENYNSGIEYITNVISKDKNNGWNYATRAMLYKAADQNNLAQNDYYDALKFCNKCNNCIQNAKKSYYEYKTYLKETMEEKRAEWRF